jgi:3-oxoacyl-[acyl-carrier protein] reductase
MKALEGKVALVTGSSRGIGAAIANTLARQGAAVAVHGRDAAALALVRSEIERVGGKAVQVLADVTVVAEIERMRLSIERELGPIDILVANAGGNPTPPGPLEEVSEEAWRAATDGNLTATFLTIKSILPGMKERRRGAIVTMSSAAARRPTSHSPIPYAAAKAGIEVLTRALAIQAGPFGIRVNCIAPELILTERNAHWIPRAQQEALAEQHPLRRLGTPEDVGRAALFLAADDAAWISGVVLDVAGGSVLM